MGASDLDKADIEATARRFDDEPTQPIKVQTSEEPVSIEAEPVDTGSDSARSAAPSYEDTPALGAGARDSAASSWARPPQSEFDIHADDQLPDEPDDLDVSGAASDEIEPDDERAGDDADDAASATRLHAGL